MNDQECIERLEDEKEIAQRRACLKNEYASDRGKTLTEALTRAIERLKKKKKVKICSECNGSGMEGNDWTPNSYGLCPKCFGSGKIKPPKISRVKGYT